MPILKITCQGLKLGTSKRRPLMKSQYHHSPPFLPSICNFGIATSVKALCCSTVLEMMTHSVNLLLAMAFRSHAASSGEREMAVPGHAL